MQGPGQINKQKKIADSRRGGFRSPQKNPVSAHVPIGLSNPLPVMPILKSFAHSWPLKIYTHQGPLHTLHQCRPTLSLKGIFQRTRANTLRAMNAYLNFQSIPYRPPKTKSSLVHTGMIELLQFCIDPLVYFDSVALSLPAGPLPLSHTHRH